VEKKLKNLNDGTRDFLVFLSHSYATISDILGNFLECETHHIQVRMWSWRNADSFIGQGVARFVFLL